MAWEWVASVSGGVIAVAGVAVGMWNTAQSQKHQRAMATEQREADRADAREERQTDLADAHRQWLRDRRADAYVEVLRIAEQVRTFVRAPIGVTSATVDDLLRRQEAATAAVTACGSAQVLHELFGWRVTLTKALSETLKGSAEAERWHADMEKMIDRMGTAARADLAERREPS